MSQYAQYNRGSLEVLRSRLKSLLDPLHVRLLLLLLKVVILWNWAFFSLDCPDRGSSSLYRDLQCLAMELPSPLDLDDQLDCWN